MKNVENDLYRRDKLLQGVAAASNILFSLEDFDKRINSSIEVIGKAADVNCVYIFENIYDTSNKNALEPRYNWACSQDPVVKELMFNKLSSCSELFPKK
jgi:hypothetical protein